MTAPTTPGAMASAVDAVKTPGVLWSAWPEDDCDSDPRIDPMAQKVTEWFVGRWPVGAEQPECRILIGEGRSAEIVARRIAEKLTSILNTDAIRAAALASPAPAPVAVPEEVRRLSDDAVRQIVREDIAKSWGDRGDTKLAGAIKEGKWDETIGFKGVLKGALLLRDILSIPSGRAGDGGEQQHLTGADRIRSGDLDARDDGNCCAGSAPPASAGAVDGWKLVPAEPTEKMLEAFCDEHEAQWNAVRADGYKPGPGDAAQPCYRAMLAVAPAAPEPAAGGERETLKRADILLALEAALVLLGRNEPGDSRAASGEFVAIASAVAGRMDDDGRQILLSIMAGPAPRSILAAGAQTAGGDEWQPMDTRPDVDTTYVDLPGDLDEGLGHAVDADTGVIRHLVWWKSLGPGRSEATHWRPNPEPPASPADAEGGQ